MPNIFFCKHIDIATAINRAISLCSLLKYYPYPSELSLRYMIAKYALPRPSVRSDNFASFPVFSFQLFQDKHLKRSEYIPKTTLRPKSGDLNLKMIDSISVVIYYLRLYIIYIITLQCKLVSYFFQIIKDSKMGAR